MKNNRLIYTKNMNEIKRLRIITILKDLILPLIGYLMGFTLYYFEQIDFSTVYKFSLFVTFFMIVRLLLFWPIWFPPDQIFGDGINFSIKLSYSTKPKNRYVFIPFENIKAFFLTQKKESDLTRRGKRKIYLEYRTAGLGFITNKQFPYGKKYVYNSFMLSYPTAKELIPVLKKVLGEEKWKELTNKPELFSEQLKDIQEDLSLDGHWKPKEDLPT